MESTSATESCVLTAPQTQAPFPRAASGARLCLPKAPGLHPGQICSLVNAERQVPLETARARQRIPLGHDAGGRKRVRPARRCADSSLPHAWGGMKESHRVGPLSPPTLPPTGQGGKASGAEKQGATRLPGQPPRRPEVTLLYGRSLQNRGWGASRTTARVPQALLPPLAAPPSPPPPRLRSLPRRPARGPTHRSRSPRGRPARPAPAAGAEGAPGAPWRGTDWAPRGGRRTLGRRPRAGGARAAPGAGFPPLALLIGAGWGRGRGVRSIGTAHSRGRAAGDPARLPGAPRPPLRRSPLLPWDSRRSSNSGPGHCHAAGKSRSAQPCLTKAFPNFYEHKNHLELSLLGRL